MSNSTPAVHDYLEANPTKHYKCHKEVDAVPVNRQDYNDLRGWELPADECGADEGYLVVYSKGTPDEYVSWSPKQQLDAGYAEIG
jgi:hypothetical protein